MIIKKRGLSAVVATISIVLITLVAFAIVTSVIMPLVKNNLDSTECLDFRDYYKFRDDLGYNCYNTTTQNTSYAFSIQAGNIKEEPEEKVIGFRLSFKNNRAETNVIDVERGVSVMSELRMLNSSKTSFEIPLKGEARTYVYRSTLNDIEKIDISAKLKSGRVCDVSDNFYSQNYECEKGKILDYK